MVIKVGTVQTINMQTGQVVEEKQGGMILLPPAGNRCQECAATHRANEPHDRDSLYYQVAFHAQHGRAPTWTDAMSHCAPEVKEAYTKILREVYTRRHEEVPEDLRQ